MDQIKKIKSTYNLMMLIILIFNRARDKLSEIICAPRSSGWESLNYEKEEIGAIKIEFVQML